jgi:YD repeat-containing protein
MQQAQAALRPMTCARGFAPTFAALLLACWLAAVTPARGQNLQYTTNTADQSLRGGLQVDPSTLGMTFSLTLANYPGRGPGLPVTLNYASKVWRVEMYNGWQGGITWHSQSEAKFAEHSVSGWTSSLGVPTVEYDAGSQAYKLEGQAFCNVCEPYPTDPPYYIDRMLVHLPDGSTHELRKNDTVLLNAPTFTGTYYAVDGSRLRYEVESATLSLPDGSRYLLNAPGGAQYVDRHGNTLSYNSTTKQWTDTLGRVIAQPPLNNATAGDQTYTLPGVGGTAAYYVLRWRNLADVRTDPAQPLRYSGDRTTGYPMGTLSPSLFATYTTEYVTSYQLFNPVVLHEIELPNGSKYTFTYNVWGEMDKVWLPSGGYERFEHGQVSGLDMSLSGGVYSQGNRGVLKHWVSASGSGTDEVMWQYATTTSGGTTVSTTVTGPDNSRAERSLHRGGSVSGGVVRYGFEDARSGRAYEERTYNASNQMIRRTLVEWAYSGPTPGGEWTATRDPRPIKKVEILLDTGGNALAATTTTTYDADLNETTINYYDYVSVDPTTAQTGNISAFPLGALLRTEEATYLVNDPNYISVQSAYRERNLLGLPTVRKVRDANGNLKAETQLRYDEAAYAPLAITGTVPGWTTPGTLPRGSVTTTRQWLDTNGSWIEMHAQTDQCGNPRKAWDAKGYLSEVRYDDAFSDGNNTRNTHAYPTKVLTPAPDPTGMKGSSAPLESTTVYEYWTGRTTSATDANNKTTIYEYEPLISTNPAKNSLNRMKRVVRPDGGETVFEYGDAPGNFYIRSQTKQDATTWVEDYTYLDGLARARRSAHKETGNSWAIKDTKYDNKGRVWQASNPYRDTSSNPASPSGLVWTTTTYDALNRVLTVTTPDSAVVTSSYSGNTATVTDQAGKAKRSEADALGRLTKVTEDLAGLNYETTYQYDALSSLKQVTQGAQVRTFVYDSLGRLTSATNPESGTLTYTYDLNSNLYQKTDARGITATYSYDRLNRNTGVSYSSYPDGTAAVERFYDHTPNGKGRLWYAVSYNYRWEQQTDNLAYHRTLIDGYDAVGRPTSQTQGVLYKNPANGNWAWADYNVQRGYDLAGNVLSQTYPSGRTVSYGYGAAGRLSTFTGTLGDGVSRNYATGLAYNAAGQMTKEAFGMQAATLYHRTFYNVRLQPYNITLGTGTSDDAADANSGPVNAVWDRGRLVNHYGSGDFTAWGTSGANNNGNVLRGHHYVPTTGPYYDIHYWDYSYDGVNRLEQVVEWRGGSYGGGEQFRQRFSYDRWGNRAIDIANTTPNVPGVTRDILTFNTANNRLTEIKPAPNHTTTLTPTYDAGGNQTSDGDNDRWFDAEGHITKAEGAGGLNRYYYDAAGQRVRRVVGEQETWLIYGLGGELVAEYAYTGMGNPAPTTAQKEYGYRGGELLIVADA